MNQKIEKGRTEIKNIKRKTDFVFDRQRSLCNIKFQRISERSRKNNRKTRGIVLKTSKAVTTSPAKHPQDSLRNVPSSANTAGAASPVNAAGAGSIANTTGAESSVDTSVAESNVNTTGAWI